MHVQGNGMNKTTMKTKEGAELRKQNQIKHQSSPSASVCSSRDGLWPPLTMKTPGGSKNQADLLLNFLSISLIPVMWHRVSSVVMASGH